MTRDDKQKPDDVQPSLLDAMADEPVPFVLTARARRAVAPESLPTLSLLAGGDVAASVDHDLVGDALADAAEIDEDEDLLDPRRARARALRRAGSSAESIALELDAEVDRVQRWTADVVAKAVHAAPKVPVNDDVPMYVELPSAYVSGRAAARASWLRGTAVSSGAAMVAGLAEVTPFSVRLRGELGLVAGVLQWLRDAVVVPSNTVSAHVAAAPGNALDRIAHEVATRLQLDLDRITPRPWHDAPDRDAVEVTIRIADPHLAGTVAGWREGLLASLVDDTQDVVVA